MGNCKDCKWCQTLEEREFIFKTTSYFCTNEPVVLARGKGKYYHDIRVEATNSCNLFEPRPTSDSIGFK